jgi:hypothetical protein
VLVVDLGFDAILASPDHGLNYLGPTLRGAFGRALKSAVCQVRHGECGRCLLLEACPYPAIFDGRPPAGQAAAWGSPALPQPFVLSVAEPDTWDGGPTDLRWSLRLFGPAASWSPYVVEAFLRIGRRGVGRRRVGFDLLAVRDNSSGIVAWERGRETMRPPQPVELGGGRLPGAGAVRWRFVTPVHIRHDAEEVRAPGGVDMVVAGRRRWALLRRFYGTPALRTDERLADTEFRVVESRLRPWGITRYSPRQDRRVQLSGTLGDIVIEGPWDRAGDWMGVVDTIHLGKYASFGFGRVTWEMA